MQLVKIANKNYNNYKQTDAYKSAVLKDSINDLYNALMREISAKDTDTFENLNIYNETMHFFESYSVLRSGGETHADNMGYVVSRTV